MGTGLSECAVLGVLDGEVVRFRWHLHRDNSVTLFGLCCLLAVGSEGKAFLFGVEVDDGLLLVDGYLRAFPERTLQA